MFNDSDTARGVVCPPRGGWRALALAAAGFVLPAGGEAARLGLNPLMGDGAAGRTTVLSGSGFLPGAILNVTVNGVATSPATVTASATGFIAPVALVLQAMPYGGNTVVLSDAARTYTFTGAYQVQPNLCLAPVQGDGRAGETSETNAAIPVGGWSGMVFRIEGTGFAAGSTVFADTITVGGSATDHPARVIDAAGRLASTTVIVTSSRSRGFQDILVPAGTSTTVFYGAYEVRRAIGLLPASGPNAGGATATIYIEGTGFDDVTITANSITIGAAATQHAAFLPVNGMWSGVVRLLGAPGNNSQNVVTAQETFNSAWVSVKGTDRKIGVIPVTLGGVPNQAIRIQGMGHWSSGQSIAADSSLVLGPGADQTTTHGAIAIGSGRFPATWIKIDGSQSDPANGIRVNDPTGGKTDTKCIDLKPSFYACPVVTSGASGWTVSLTGFGLSRNRVMTSLTVTGGSLAGIVGTPTSDTFGETPTFAVVLPAIASGGWSASLFDTVRNYELRRLVAVRPTIGLSAVNGPGGAGETTDIVGTGFPAAGSLAANAILLTGTAAATTTHSPIGFTATGTFGPATVTLPQLPAGAYDLTAQGVFPSAYRVTPMIALSKHVSPVSGGPGDVIAYSFSFTNIGVGDAAGVFALVDTIPTGMRYQSGSGASLVPGTTIDWRSWTCSCYVGAEPAAADVAAVRWRLPGALPLGASGVVSFRVTLQ